MPILAISQPPEVISCRDRFPAGVPARQQHFRVGTGYSSSSGFWESAQLRLSRGRVRTLISWGIEHEEISARSDRGRGIHRIRPSRPTWPLGAYTKAAPMAGRRSQLDRLLHLRRRRLAACRTMTDNDDASCYRAGVAINRESATRAARLVRHRSAPATTSSSATWRRRHLRRRPVRQHQGHDHGDAGDLGLYGRREAQDQLVRPWRGRLGYLVAPQLLTYVYRWLSPRLDWNSARPSARSAALIAGRAPTPCDHKRWLVHRRRRRIRPELPARPVQEDRISLLGIRPCHR